MKNTFSSSQEAIHDYLVQHTRVMARCAASFVGGFDFAYIEVVKDCISGCTAVVQEGNIRKTMAARGLVNGRGPRSGRDLVFRCYPPELLLTPKKTEADLLGQPPRLLFQTK